MTTPRIGIIGGSGLGQAMAGTHTGREVVVETPFGAPSGPILLTEVESVPVAFLARHGPGHRHSPSTVPYRANVYALKTLGVTHILASGATGSLREEIRPRDLVICDQVIDKTFRRLGTFFDDGVVVHVEFAEPFCPVLRAAMIAAAEKVPTTVHAQGTYVCMEGPQFSTRAEALMHRAWSGDLIGMTCMPEAKLAREAEIAYALVALPTDYDCWRPHDPAKDKQALLSEILGNLRVVTDHAIALLREVIRTLGPKPPASPCHTALEMAIWSDRGSVPRDVIRRLGPLVGKYFPAS